MEPVSQGCGGGCVRPQMRVCSSVPGRLCAETPGPQLRVHREEEGSRRPRPDPPAPAQAQLGQRGRGK